MNYSSPHIAHKTQPALQIKMTNYKFHMMAKRMFDIVFSLLVILLIFPIIFPIVFIFIKLLSTLCISRLGVLNKDVLHFWF